MTGSRTEFTTNYQRHGLQVEGLDITLGSFHLKDFSLHLAPGSITALLGHNGAGKTTTLRLLAGILRRDAGHVRSGQVDSIDNQVDYKQRVAFVADEGTYYEQLKVKELIRFTSRFFDNWNQAHCDQLLGELALDGNLRIGALSRGSRLKLGLILAFARNADVLLLDEPTSTLDPRIRKQVVELIEQAARRDGRAILLATHNLHEAQSLVDQVVIVDHGSIVYSDALSPEMPVPAPPSRKRPVNLEELYLGLVS
jgi:ABC-2 type transport system ATP-binding protein